jgi:hypothetical protein
LTSKENRKWCPAALRKITSVVLLKHGKNYGIDVQVCHRIEVFGNGVFSWIGWSGEDATTATQQPTSQWSCGLEHSMLLL